MRTLFYSLLFTLFSLSAAASASWSEDEVYTIKAAGTGLYLTTNVASGTYVFGATPETFKIVGSEAEGFTLQSASSGKYVGYAHAWNCTDHANAWDIQPSGDGYAFYRHSQTTGLGWDSATSGSGIYTDKSNSTLGVWLIEVGEDPLAYEIDFTSMGYDNAQDFDGQSIEAGDATLTLSKGTGATTPKYYNTGTAIRLYGSNTIVISSEKTIAKIKFTFAEGEDGSSRPYYATEDNTSFVPGNYDYESQTWTGSSQSVTMTNTRAGGHLRIQKIKITFEPEEPESLKTSTADSPVWYTIGSYKRGGYLTANADNSLTHVEATDYSKWWIESVDKATGAAVLHNANGKVIASKWQLGDTPMNVYIMPCGDSGYYCISATNPLSGMSCLDAYGNSTQTGSWTHSEGYLDGGTTWVFAETDAPETVEQELGTIALDNLVDGWYQIKYSKAGWVSAAVGKKLSALEFADAIEHNGDDYEIVSAENESAYSTLFYFENTGETGTNSTGSTTNLYTIRLSNGHKIGKGGSRTGCDSNTIGIDAPDIDKSELRFFSTNGQNYLDLFGKNSAEVLGGGINQSGVRFKACDAAGILAGVNVYTVVYAEGVTGEPTITYNNTEYTGIKTVVNGGAFFLAATPAASDFTSQDAGDIATYIVVDAEAKTITVCLSVTAEDMANAAAAAKDIMNLRGVGYPSAESEEYATLSTAIANVEGATTPSSALIGALQTALDTYKACTNIEKPVVGKRYAFAAVSSAEGNNQLGYITYSADGIIIADKSDDALLKCVAEVGGKFVFQFVRSGKYLVYKNSRLDSNAGENENKGYADEYDAAYAAFDIATIASSNFVTKEVPFGLVSLSVDKRNSNIQSPGCLIINNDTKAFDTTTSPFFNGTFTSAFAVEDIDPTEKVQLPSGAYTVLLPAEDVCYDGNAHAATVQKNLATVGETTVLYVNRADNSTSYDPPTVPGTYDVLITIAESEIYYGIDESFVGTFTIYALDTDEWNSLLQLHAQLQDKAPDWNIDGGVEAAGSFQGLTIQQGHVIGIDLSGRGLSEVPPALFIFTQLKTLNLARNNLSGNVSQIAAQLPSLRSLDVSGNNFAELYPAISPQITTLDISNQTIDRTIQLHLSDMSLTDIISAIPSIILYDHQNQTYNSYTTLVLTTTDNDYLTADDWAVQVTMNTEVANISALSSDATYYGQSGSTVRVVKRTGSSLTGTSFRAVLNFEYGDANFTNGVDAADLQTTILYAFGAYGGYPFNFTAADTYTDGAINVQDVICTVNILLAQTPAQARGMRKAKQQTHDFADQSDAYIYMHDGNIILCTEQPVAALSVTATGDVKWNLDHSGLQQTVSGANLVGYSLSGATLPAGETVIGTYGTQATIHHASLADAKAQPISVALGDTDPTAIHQVPLRTTPAIFDLTGRKLNHPAKGLYIQNGKLRIKK